MIDGIAVETLVASQRRSDEFSAAFHRLNTLSSAPNFALKCKELLEGTVRDGNLRMSKALAVRMEIRKAYVIFFFVLVFLLAAIVGSSVGLAAKSWNIGFSCVAGFFTLIQTLAIVLT